MKAIVWLGQRKSRMLMSNMEPEGQVSVRLCRSSCECSPYETNDFEADKPDDIGAY